MEWRRMLWGARSAARALLLVIYGGPVFGAGGIRCVEMALWPGVNGAPFWGYVRTLSVDLCERYGVLRRPVG